MDDTIYLARMGARYGFVNGCSTLAPILSLVMNVLGSQRVAGQRWHNPASPDVLRALPWEFGDGDMFLSTLSRTMSPTLGSQESTRSLGPPWANKLPSGPAEFHASLRPGTANSISAGMARSASSPETPALSPEPPVELPAYLIAKPSTLPSVFVRDSPEYLRSQAEIAATLGSSETIKRSSRIGSAISISPTSPSNNGRRGARQSQLIQPQGSPHRQATLLTARGRRDVLDVAETGTTTSGAATSSSSQRESFASPPVPAGGSSGGVLAPSRAKSTPEFASRVRFKLDDEIPPALPATVRVRGSSSSGAASSSKGVPPSSYLLPSERRNDHRKSGSNGPLVLPPLNIPSTSSLASAAEDISSASAAVKHQVEERRRQRQGSVAGTSTSSRMAEMPPLMDKPTKQSSKRRLRNIDSVAMIEHAIAKNRKNPQ
jgi:hypothetical protein